MLDYEIKQYLEKNNYRVNSQDCLMNVLNTSPQIIDTIYDFETRTMTIITPDNEFTFEWVLRKL
jgi:hypothetical protein